MGNIKNIMYIFTLNLKDRKGKTRSKKVCNIDKEVVEVKHLGLDTYGEQ